MFLSKRLGMAQVVECLPSKHRLSLLTAKTKTRKGMER
jgi:hypothetical protein